MFGASEDRARQLAYRKRRERFISGGSCSAYRSLSSESRTSQQSHLYSTPKQDATHPTVCVEHCSSQTELMHVHKNACVNQYRNPQSKVNPVLATDVQHPQTEQHRVQAEYLSQVLYNHMSLDMVGCRLSGIPVPSSQFGRHETPGQTTARRHIRHITAPVASARLTSLFASTMESHLNLPILPSLHYTTFNNHPQTQTVISLRGGGQDNTLDNLQPNQLGPDLSIRHLTPTSVSTGSVIASLPHSDFARYHTHKRQYMNLFPWTKQFHAHPAFLVPISSGHHFLVFMRKLLPTDASTFLFLFGPSQPAAHWASPASNTRRAFYQKLDDETKVLFQNVVIAREQELVYIEDGGADSQLNAPQAQTIPCVMIYHLLEALENPFIPTPISRKSEADYDREMKWSLPQNHSMRLRTSSQPSFGQQPGHSGYPTSAALSIYFHD
jgi:hypothetical protein